MLYPTRELCEQYMQERLKEAENERLIQRFKQGRNSASGMKLFTKVVVTLGDLLVSSGLKLKHTVRYEVQS